MENEPCTSRRQFLVSTAAVAGALWAQWIPGSARAAGECCPQYPGIPNSGRGGVRVSLHPPGGGHYLGQASVKLTDSSGKETPLDRLKGEQVFLGYFPPDVYGLNVTVSGFDTFLTKLEVVNEVLMVAVYLRKPGWPTFRMGPSIVPFEPILDQLGIVFVSPFWLNNKKQVIPYLQALDKLGLAPYSPDPADKWSFVQDQGSVILLRTKDPNRAIFSSKPHEAPSLAAEALFADVRAVFPVHRFGTARLGVPISTTRERWKVLDNQFIVEFKSGMTEAQIKELVTTVDATVSRIPYLDDCWLLTFRYDSNYLRNLRTVDDLLGSGTLVSGEPNLLFELTRHGCSSPVTDGWYPCQDYIGVQRIADAWDFLAQIPAGARCGKPAVVVATLDDGVNRLSNAPGAHPDLNPAITCFDLHYLSVGITPTDDRPTDCRYVPDNAHGMGVFGIIGAPHNGSHVAGIAADTTHVAVRWNPTMSTASYATTLLWMGAIGGTKPVDKNNKIIASAPTLPAAWLINCSHGLEYIPLPRRLKKAYTRLTKEGRGGSGIVVVYSAGQGNGPGGTGADVQGVQAAAMSPCTIIVSNTVKITASGAEVHDPNANFGMRIDICGFGGLNVPFYSEGAPALNRTGNDIDTPDSCEGISPKGIWRFDRTSAAAPMVTGVAALMLSTKHSLKWFEVRAILQASAAKVDAACADPVGLWKKRTASGWVPPGPGESPTPGLDWRSDWYGFGRLDALPAVQNATAGSVPSGVTAPAGCS